MLHRVQDVVMDHVKKFETSYDSLEWKEEFDINHVKYKQLSFQKLVALYVPEWIQSNENRTNVVDKRFAKYRAEYAWVICIVDMLTLQSFSKFNHYRFQKSTWYQTRTFVFPDSYTRDPDKVCACGIHYFNSFLPAFFFQPKLKEMRYRIDFSDDGAIYSIECDGKVYVTSCISSSLLRRTQDYFRIYFLKM